MRFSTYPKTKHVPSIKGAACFFSTVLLWALCLLVLSPASAMAEGSKDLVLYGGYRPYIEQYGSSSADESQTTEVGVYVRSGETLYFGSSVRIANLGLTNDKMGMDFSDEELVDLNENHIIVCSPDWDREKNPHAYPYINGEQDQTVSLYRVDKTIDNNLRGFISSYADELSGPAISGVEEESNSPLSSQLDFDSAGDLKGYTPHTLTAEVEGVYHFRFCSVNESAQEPRATVVGEDEDFELNQGSATVAAWDVSVYSAEGGSQSGRVFVNELFLNMGANVPGEDVLNSKVHVLTSDGYEYQVDFNGMDPFNLKFFSNLRGMLKKTEAGYQSLYHSVKSQSRSLSDLVENEVYSNIKPTEDSDQTHRVFLNRPDAFALQQFTGFDYLSDGTLKNTVEDVVFTPSFNPEDVEDGTIVGFGGTFSFYNEGAIEGSSYQITLDFGDTDTPDNKVVLSNSLVKGNNLVYWDGLDQYGQTVPSGVYDNDILVEIKGGEAHFPLIDINENRKGVKITLMNDIDEVIDKTVVHYNNLSNKQTYQGSWGEENWTLLDKVDMSAGVSSAEGVLAYGQESGSYAVLDLWAYQAHALSLPCRFEVYQGTMPFAVSQRWDTAGDSASVTPAEGDRIDLQLQWRIKGSKDTWQNYDGLREEYHEPLASFVQSTYDPASPLFVGLEQYFGRDIASGDPLTYQYRVVPRGLPSGYQQIAAHFESYDLNGVAYALDAEYAYRPDSGIITVVKEWEGDDAATGVRPQGLRIKVFQRTAGSDDAWEEASASEGEGVVLSADDGWCADVVVPLAEKGLSQEYYLTLVSYSLNGEVWLMLDSNRTEFLAGDISQGSNYNAPGYTDPVYAIDDGEARGYWSNGFELYADKPLAKVTISDLYQTALTVSHVWETGVDPQPLNSVTVQLQQDGVDVEGAFVELTKDNPSHTFEGLEVGHSYTTRILASAQDYRIQQGKVMGEIGYSLINNTSQRGYYESYTSVYRYTALTVTKEWDGDQTTQDPVAVQMEITFNDGQESYRQSAALSADNGWEHTFYKLPVGGGISVGEGSSPEGFIALYDTLTGTDLSGYTQELFNKKESSTITLQKTWEGDGSASGVRPDAVRLQLYYREKGSNAQWRTYDDNAQGLYELSSLNRWTLDVAVERARAEKELEYYVEEVAYKKAGASAFTTLSPDAYAPGYALPVYSLDEGSVSEGASSIIDLENRTLSKVNSISTYTTLFTVVAAWQQQSGEAGEMLIQLQKDGENIPGATVALDPINTTHTFSDLATGHFYAVTKVSQHEGFEESYTEVQGEDGYSTIGSEVERGYYQGVTNVEVAIAGNDLGSEAQRTENGIRMTLGAFALVALGVGVYFLIVAMRKRPL